VVGAVVGLGFYYHAANLPLAATVLGWWIVTPLASLTVSYLLGRFAYPRLVHAVGRFRSEAAVRRVIAWAVTISGCWMAFAAGSNSLAKAVGPAVGAGVFSAGEAAVLGGLGMALGALLLGGRVIKTVGKEITSICPVCAILVEVVSASIVFTSSRFGVPVSLAEIVTCSVIGFSLSAKGLRSTTENRHVRRILVLWPAAPVLAALLAFVLEMAFK
jgi:sulfate permease